MVVASFSFNMHFLFTYNLFTPPYSNTAICSIEDQYWTNLWFRQFYIIAFALRTVIPFSILLVSNIFIVSRIVISIRQRMGQMRAARSNTENTNEGKVFMTLNRSIGYSCSYKCIVIKCRPIFRKFKVIVWVPIEIPYQNSFIDVSQPCSRLRTFRWLLSGFSRKYTLLKFLFCRCEYTTNNFQKVYADFCRTICWTRKFHSHA